MVKTPKYPLVMMDDCFDEKEIDSLMGATIVLEYAVFRERNYLELKRLAKDFRITLELTPDYPGKQWDLEHQDLVVSIYDGYLSGKNEGMNKREAFELLSNSIKPKTLYLGGDIDLYIWKTKSNIHIYNVSSCEIQHIVYYKSRYSGEIYFYVPQ